MTRCFRGKRRDMPPGMEPMEWVQAVWAVMEEEGVDEAEARRRVADEQRRVHA